ncbi:MAG: MarR family transcriptional regulator [Phenylobacterium sp.]
MKTPPAPAFANTLPILLLRAREALLEPTRSVLRRHGLTEQQYRVLRTLSTVEEMETTQLARAVCLRPPSVSRILRDLERTGRVARRGGSADQRVILVSLEPAGRELIAQVLPAAAAIGARVGELYGRERLERLRALLLELEAVLADGRF